MLVCKSIESCSTRSSHVMTVCYHLNELENLDFPIFIQQFIPHAFIYKVFLIGPKMFIIKRPFITISNDRGIDSIIIHFYFIILISINIQQSITTKRGFPSIKYQRF